MIYPRLYLARTLLREDGVIFISIDDHEQSHLRNLCDHIFGEENFVAQFVWERAYAPKNDAKYVSNSHDYVLMFAKNIDAFDIGRLKRSEEANAKYSNPDNDLRGEWKPSDMSVKSYNAQYDYPITTPSGRVVEPPAGRCWSLSKKAFFERLADNRIWVGANGNSVPSLKRFMSELRHEGMVPTSILFYKDVGHSQEGAKEVVALFENQGSFDGPKPVRLLHRLIAIGGAQSNDLILDFFSGSATTAHAVMQLNAQDGGNRRFIMVQLPEPCAPESEAYKAGYPTIAAIGRERIRRAGQKILKERAQKHEGQLALDAPPPLDIGFRAFRLDASNARPWNGQVSDAALAAQLDLHIDPINPASSKEDLLYEIILKAGYLLTEAIAPIQLGNNFAYSLRDHSFIICLDEQITFSFADALMDYNPSLVVCLDRAFAGDDQLKANLVQSFKARARAEEAEIVFRTV